MLQQQSRQCRWSSTVRTSSNVCIGSLLGSDMLVPQPGIAVTSGSHSQLQLLRKNMLLPAVHTQPVLFMLAPYRFNAINGLLLPGGGADLSPGHPFYDTAAKLVSMAIEANDRGDYFPVSGSGGQHSLQWRPAVSA